MDNHGAFNVYSKHTISERISDTLFFKNKYLTSPTMTPGDTVTESAKILIYAVISNSKSTDSGKKKKKIGKSF